MRTKETNAQNKSAEKEKESKPNKRFSRRDALKAGLALVGAAVLKTGCSSEYKADKNDGGLDGSTSDASGLDANVSHDASMLDGSVHDAGLDAKVPDATVPQDAAATCVSNEDSLVWQQMHPGDLITVGGYNVRYVSMTDLDNITVDVTCVTDNSSVAAGLTLPRSQEQILLLPDGMNLKMTFMNGSWEYVNVNAAVALAI